MDKKDQRTMHEGRAQRQRHNRTVTQAVAQGLVAQLIAQGWTRSRAVREAVRRVAVTGVTPRQAR